MTRSDLIALARFRILDARNCNEEAKDRLLGQMADEIELLHAALKVTRQALMEVRHAQECGPGWYTRGASGLYQQTSMWVRKGLDAARDALREVPQ